MLPELSGRAASLVQAATQLSGFSSLILFMFIATCYVDEAVSGDSEHANAAIVASFEALYGEKRWDDEDSLRRLKRGVVMVIRMLDQLYREIGHCAFELLIYLCKYKPDLPRTLGNRSDSYTSKSSYPCER